MTEGFKFYKPCQLLQDYVRYYWIFESNQPIKTYTFPIGCPQLIFHKKSALYIPELNTKQDRLTISGQVNFSSHISAEDSVEMIVVVFHPYAMSAFCILQSGSLRLWTGEQEIKLSCDENF
mgnify:CR=1 FL=1